MVKKRKVGCQKNGEKKIHQLKMWRKLSPTSKGFLRKPLSFNGSHLWSPNGSLVRGGQSPVLWAGGFFVFPYFFKPTCGFQKNIRLNVGKTPMPRCRFDQEEKETSWHLVDVLSQRLSAAISWVWFRSWHQALQNTWNLTSMATIYGDHIWRPYMATKQCQRSYSPIFLRVQRSWWNLELLEELTTKPWYPPLGPERALASTRWPKKKNNQQCEDPWKITRPRVSWTMLCPSTPIMFAYEKPHCFRLF